MVRGYYPLRYDSSMIRFALRLLLAASFALAAVPVFAQTPGVDENDCKPSPLLTRMPGCGVYE